MKQPTFDEFEDTVSSLRELTKKQLDLVILVQLLAMTPSSLSSKRKDPSCIEGVCLKSLCKDTLCIEDSVYVGKPLVLSIQLVKKG